MPLFALKFTNGADVVLQFQLSADAIVLAVDHAEYMARDLMAKRPAPGEGWDGWFVEVKQTDNPENVRVVSFIPVQQDS